MIREAILTALAVSLLANSAHAHEQSVHESPERLEEPLQFEANIIEVPAHTVLKGKEFAHAGIDRNDLDKVTGVGNEPVVEEPSFAGDQ